MRALAVELDAAARIGRGEPKVHVVAERDGVTIEVLGEWVAITELAPVAGTERRCILTHGSKVKRVHLLAGVLALEDEPEAPAPEPAPPAAAVARAQGARK